MKKAIITILISLVLALSVIAAKDLFSADIPISNRGIRAAALSGDLDVLFIGSSTFRCNIDMPTLDEAFDGRVYDISYGGNQAIASLVEYDEFKKRSENAHKLIVFELDPLMLTEEVKISDSRVIWDLSWSGKKRLWDEMKKSGNTDSALWYEYFISSGMDDLITYPVTEPFYAGRYYKGAKNEETPSSGKEYLDNEAFDLNGLSTVKAQADAVKELIEELKADGQDYVFLESPRYVRLAEDPVYNKYRSDFIEILKKAGAPYILSDDVDFDEGNPGFFEDMNHMSADGRREYTHKLIPLLTRP